MYYYGYYLLSQFSKRFNNNDGDFAFTAVIYYTLLFTLNILTSIFLFCTKDCLKSHSNMVILVSIAIPVVIHYFFLVRKKKYIEVIKEYNKVYKNKNIIITYLFCIYVFLTFACVIYVAHLLRGSW